MSATLPTTPVTTAPAFSRGLRYVAMSAFWFSIMSVLVKVMGRRLPIMEVVLFRGILTLVLSYLVIRQAEITPVLGRNHRKLVLRGLLGAAALSCFFTSLVYLPLGEATLIQYMNPVFASLLAARVYGERARRSDLLALGASLVGVVLITRPAFLFGVSSEAIPPMRVLIALGGAIFSGSAYATIRQMPEERAEVIVMYLPIMTIPLALPFAIGGWVTPHGWDWAGLLALGITTQLGQTSMTRGLQLERTARATTVGYLQIVFAVLWGALLLGETPTMWTLAGAIVIIASTLGIAWIRQLVTGTEE